MNHYESGDVPVPSRHFPFLQRLLLAMHGLTGRLAPLPPRLTAYLAMMAALRQRLPPSGAEWG